jgi:Ca-activated chloride channel homolog
MWNRIKIPLVVAVLVNISMVLGWYFVKDLYEYKDANYFYLLSLVPVFSIFYIWRYSKSTSEIKISSLRGFGEVSFDWIGLFRNTLFVFKMGGLFFLITALARPQSNESWKDITTEGIDIVLSMDISTSMLARDFSPNRLEAAKDVAMKFIADRPNDRIGLVVYEGESFTQCPLTTDHRVLINLFKDVKPGMIEGGTAVGMGLANAVNRLRDSESKSKVVILLTDGENNAGSVSPETAAEIAKQFGVRVYTIGVGSKGKAMGPVAIYPDGSLKFDMVDVKIDEESLTNIANITGGEYFRATNKNKLADIYKKIDELEKTKISVSEQSQKYEEYFWFAAIGSLLFVIEFLLRNTVFKTVP